MNESYEQIGVGMRIKMAYELKNEQGIVLEERTPENPYDFIYGSGQILQALEKALLSQTAGFEFELQVQPQDAYGHYRSDLVITVSKGMLPSQPEVRVGMKFNTMGPENEPVTVRVIEVAGDKVTLDGNHPLAGETLRFRGRVLDVRRAEAEEILSDSAVTGHRQKLH